VTARIIDGKAIAKKLRAEYHVRVDALKAKHGITAALAVILVGDNPASQSYVRNKIAGCRDIGIRSELIQLPASAAEAEVLQHIETLNNDPAIHGILVQLPLPVHIRVSSVLERISVEKDVDGFHLYNMGGLVTGSTVFSPCTPYGVQKILEHENIPVEGRNVVVVGASNIVGKPTALMLMQQDATVCICHKKTRDLGQFTLLADILVVAAGVPNLIVPQMVKTGAVVIDVGYNRLPDGRIVGDVDFEGVKAKASYITPVPGGVGQMTVTMLLHNTILSAERAASAVTQAFRPRTPAVS
jgi:methylenetetrahydrofolate dehydrogenase (NADP+) / methenyltetrahydrofolate cyclohydrolase